MQGLREGGGWRAWLVAAPAHWLPPSPLRNRLAGRNNGITPSVPLSKWPSVIAGTRWCCRTPTVSLGWGVGAWGGCGGRGEPGSGGVCGRRARPGEDNKHFILCPSHPASTLTTPIARPPPTPCRLCACCVAWPRVRWRVFANWVKWTYLRDLPSFLWASFSSSGEPRRLGLAGGLHPAAPAGVRLVITWCPSLYEHSVVLGINLCCPN